MVEFNRVFLIGNLTRDPEVKYLPSGMAVARLRLASNRRFKDRSGEMREEALFISVEAWGRQAELCQQYMAKGRRVLVEGRLQQNDYTTQDGQKRSEIRIVADRVHFMDSRGGEGAPPQDDSGGFEAADAPAGANRPRARALRRPHPPPLLASSRRSAAPPAVFPAGSALRGTFFRLGSRRSPAARGWA
jgi:single-strand DNA-binding protein